MATKRALEESDAADATPVKRGRGRPRKDPKDLKTPHPDPDAPKRGRGRPRKNPDAPVVEKVPSGRGRGRPRKNPDAPPAEKPTPSGRGRGRPRKSEAAEENSASTESASNAKSPSKSGIKLSDTVGTYSVSCKEVEENWNDDVAGNMEISISTIKNSSSGLIASFNLGILEGTMLLAADEATLERVREDVEQETASKSKSVSTSPAINDRTVYFVWRGQGVGDEDQIYPGTDDGQSGWLKFKDDKCTSFEGKGVFPGLGEACPFTGKLVDRKTPKKPEPWNTYDEKDAEEANEST